MSIKHCFRLSSKSAFKLSTSILYLARESFSCASLSSEALFEYFCRPRSNSMSDIKCLKISRLALIALASLPASKATFFRLISLPGAIRMGRPSTNRCSAIKYSFIPNLTLFNLHKKLFELLQLPLFSPKLYRISRKQRHHLFLRLNNGDKLAFFNYTFRTICANHH